MLIGEYAQFMSQYSETMQKMEAVDDGSLNDTELQYYTEVMGRITEMLAEISV